MELRQYWDIIRRRLWILIALTLGALVISVFIQLQPATNYEATANINFQVNTPLLPGATEIDRRTNIVQATEYFLDDLNFNCDDPVFLRQVYAAVKGEPVNDKMKPDFDATFQKAHQTFSVKVKASNADYAVKVANEIVREVVGPSPITGPTGLAGKMRPDTPPQFQIITPPAISKEPSVVQDLLLTLVRTLLGVVAALAIIFLLAYLDNHIRTADDIQQYLGLPLIGEIPSEQEVAKRLGKKTQGAQHEKAVPLARSKVETS